MQPLGFVPKTVSQFPIYIYVILFLFIRLEINYSRGYKPNDESCKILYALYDLRVFPTYYNGFKLHI